MSTCVTNVASAQTMQRPDLHCEISSCLTCERGLNRLRQLKQMPWASQVRSHSCPARSWEGAQRSVSLAASPQEFYNPMAGAYWHYLTFTYIYRYLQYYIVILTYTDHIHRCNTVTTCYHETPIHVTMKHPLPRANRDGHGLDRQEKARSTGKSGAQKLAIAEQATATACCCWNSGASLLEFRPWTSYNKLP